MIEFAGSINPSVAILATIARENVANIEKDFFESIIYPLPMLDKWLQTALEESGVKHAELAFRHTSTYQDVQPQAIALCGFPIWRVPGCYEVGISLTVIFTSSPHCLA